MPRPAHHVADDPALDRHDADLLGRWRDTQDEVALQELIARHRPMIEAVCQRILRSAGDPDDAVQETLIALSTDAADIRERPGAWLRRVAINRALMQARQHQRRRQQALVEPAAPAADEPDTESDALLRACLAELSDEDRDLLVRLFWLGETQAAIARGEGIPRVYVHRRQQRALDRLRHVFARRGVRIAVPALALLLAGGDRALAASAGAAGAVGMGSSTSFALLASGIALVLAALGAVMALGQPARQEPVASSPSATVPAAASPSAAEPVAAHSSPPAPIPPTGVAPAGGASHSEAVAASASAPVDELAARLIASFDPTQFEIGVVAAAARSAAAAAGAGVQDGPARGHTLIDWTHEPHYTSAAASPWANAVRLSDGRRGLSLRPPADGPLYLRSHEPMAESDQGTCMVLVLIAGGSYEGLALAVSTNLIIDGGDVLFESETPVATANGIGRRRTWKRDTRTPALENSVHRFVSTMDKPTVLVGFEHRALTQAECATIVARCPGRQGEDMPSEQ
ncbi:MAG: sigma-70 family RNA polymerase sigma factor [Planctomycetes bacterium]|nr:sigma-70 family RNA polymerase sigma factor [Planctomycetota bacterium]